MKETLPTSADKKYQNPLVSTASVDAVLAARKASEEIAANSQEFDTSSHLKNLEKYLADIFEDARKFKEDETDIQKIMLDCLSRRNGEYTSEKLNLIKSANSAETYIPLTGVKCRAIEAFINDIYLNAKKKRTWNLRPTPIVSISDEDTKRIVDAVMAASVQQIAQSQQPATPPDGQEAGEEDLASAQQVESPRVAMSPMEAYEMASNMRAEIIRQQYVIAEKKAENMSRKVDDQMTEGAWACAVAECITDLSALPAMILKGPIFRKRKVKTGWKSGKIQYGQKLTATFERTSPLDFYPSRYSKEPNDGTPLCEKITIQRSSLVENMDEPGYIKKNIEHIVMNTPSIPQSDFSSERKDVENKENTASAGAVIKQTIGSTLDGIEFYCSVRGSDLIDFGIVNGPDNKPINVLFDYEVNAITSSGLLVFVEYNKDELKRRPYSVCGFAREIGGFWYKSPPQILKDIQDIVNAAARAMVNNMGWSSGPQIIIPDINRLSPNEDITNIYVGKIWQGIVSGAASTNKLIEFYQPDSRSVELLRVIDEFIGMSDKVIEMPSYTYGDDKVAGAGRTSSGLSMLMSNSNRGIKRVVLDIDNKVYKNAIDQIVDYNLQNETDDSFKGDMNFVSEGVMALMMKEQLSEQRLKFLQTTANEWDMKVIGLEGRAKILSEALESLESSYDDIAPTPEKIQRLLKQEQIIEEQQIRENEMKIREKEALIQREAQIAQMEAQIEMQKLELQQREQDLEFKNKERELDIRSEKQSGDRMNKVRDQNIKAQEKGVMPDGGGQNAPTR